MHELPKDLTNSLRSFRGSVYGRGQARQSADETRRVQQTDLEKGSEDYGDKQFDRALDSSQSSTDMQSATSAQHLDATESNPQQNLDADPEKQDQRLRFVGHEEEEEEQDEQDHARGPERPRVNTSLDKAKRGYYLSPETPGKQSILLGAHVKDVDPAAERLAQNASPLSTPDFYELMGLTVPSPGNDRLSQLIKPGGLYRMISKAEKRTHWKYRTFAIAVYVFLVLQLVISAVFIILGSLRNVDTHITIAILGAVSTVIAGGLSLMQGQGLPNRLRQTRDSLRDVLVAADELYWDKQAGRDILYKDIKKIREDFLRVLQEQRRNNPDVWQSASRIEEGISTTPEGERASKK